MKVRITERCEDSNEFARGEPDNGPIDGVTVDHRARKFSVVRVDKFGEGWEGELPAEQANNLIALGYAEAV